ncbi:MAG: hypothetical protein AAGA42_12335 [Actinomycetota bacterium]
MIGWFERTIVDTGRLPLFLCFLAFIVTFAVTRGITRMIRAGRGPFDDNVSSSGVHVHHAVPGVILMSSGAFLAVGAGGAAGWSEIAGIMVGIGASLVLDEFALILHLDDVYWAEDGRVSVEMVALAVACLGLGLLGSNPFRVDGTEDLPILVGTIIGITLHLVFVAIAVAKGKYRMALLGTFIPLISLVAATRLARPTSRWARRYDKAKLRRATERAQRHDARYGPVGRRVSDVVAGAPETAEEAALDDRPQRG